MESACAAKMKEYHESDRKHFKNSVRRYVAKLKDDHDASMLVMGSNNTSVLPGQDTGDVNERQAMEMQSPEHPHTSGDDETGVDRSSGESERSTETHANPSGYGQNSRAPGSSR